MVYEDYKIEGDKITLTKKELEECCRHYCKVGDKFKPKKGDEKFNFEYPFYLGKADALTDILKMFEPLEGL